MNEYWYMTIYCGTMGTQLSFTVSGFFNCYIVYPMMVKVKGRVPFILFALKRWLRIIPALGATILLIFISQIVSTAPTMKEASDLFSDACYKNWWSTIFMVNNIVTGGSQDNVSRNVSIGNRSDCVIHFHFCLF